MFNSDLEIRVWIFSYYSICETNPILQTPNKLVIPLDGQFLLIICGHDVDVLIHCLSCKLLLKDM